MEEHIIHYVLLKVDVTERSPPVSGHMLDQLTAHCFCF